MNADPFRILITSAGTATAIGIIKALQCNKKFEIHTADTNERSRLAVDAFRVASHTVVPAASNRALYLLSIKALVKERRLDYIYPVHDEEIRVVAEARESGLHIRGPNTSAQAVFDCTDKLKAAEIGVAAGLPVPKTIAGKSLPGLLSFPIFIKPRRGVGSVGGLRANSIKDLETLPLEHVVGQECCLGPEVTVDVLATRMGIVAVARERVEVKAGVSVKAHVSWSAEFAGLASQVSEVYRLSGLFCFQVMKCGGEWVLTDINPRCGGATAMTTAAGMNLIEEFFLMERDGLHEQRFAKLKKAAEELKPCFVVRYYEEFVTERQSI